MKASFFEEKKDQDQDEHDERAALEHFENAFYNHKKLSQADLDYQPGQRMFQTVVLKPRPTISGNQEKSAQ
jgi:hypothetical protein